MTDNNVIPFTKTPESVMDAENLIATLTDIGIRLSPHFMGLAVVIHDHTKTDTFEMLVPVSHNPGIPHEEFVKTLVAALSSQLDD